MQNSGAPRAQDIIAKAQRILRPFTLDVKEVVWWSIYEIGHRLTDKFDDVPEDQVAAGAQLYRAGNSNTAVPACMACHGPDGKGNAPAGWPALGGQHPEYIAKQLNLYASGERSTDLNNIMRDIAARLSRAEIDAVSQYVSGLH